jgi:hypothetical protein
MPLGRGLATATTSATFFQQFEQRILAASFASVTDLPAIRASASGSMLTRRPARAADAHEEVTEAVVQLLDVRQHAHACIVRSVPEPVHSVRDSVPTCMAPAARGIRTPT